jgi:VPDSG-CTERM motif
MKTLILAAIRCSLMFLVTGSLFSVQPAQAYTVTLQQIGSNVVATGSGPINLTGLTLSFPGAISFVVVFASVGQIETGPVGRLIDGYTGFAGPPSFGSGGLFFPNTGSGDFVGIDATANPLPFIAVPQGYVSGSALSDSMTFNNATFASLGVIPGTYTWTWGTGLPNQNFTLVIGRATVPDGGTTVSLLGFALLGLAALRRKLSC